MALLSALPDEVGDGIIAFNDQRKAFSKEPMTIPQIKEKVAETRDKGYASRTLNTQPALSALGVVIPDSNRGPIGALSVRDIATNLQGKRKDQLVVILRRAVEDIGRAVQKNLHGEAIAASLSAAQKRPLSAIHSTEERFPTAVRSGSR